MHFRSKIDVDIFMFNQPFDGLNVRKEVWKFSRNKIVFTKRQIKKYADQLHVNPFDARWSDGTLYYIQFNDDHPKYRVILGTFPVSLRINKWNEFKLNWINKKHWIQSDKSNWLKQGLVAGLISIATYFVGQNIGFNKGYESGLKQGKEAAQKAIPPMRTINNK